MIEGCKPRDSSCGLQLQQDIMNNVEICDEKKCGVGSHI